MNVAIEFGELSLPIEKQLEKQKIICPSGLVYDWQVYADSLSLLAFAGLLTGLERDRGEKRLAKMIAKTVSKK